MRRSDEGFTILEFMIGLSIFALSSLAVSIQLRSMKKTLDETTQLMAMDAFERSIGDYLKSKEIIEFSVSKNPEVQLRNCFAGRGCLDGASFDISLYRFGEKNPISGPEVLYDSNGLLCRDAKLTKSSKDKSCGSFYLKTVLQTLCLQASTCPTPQAILLRADLYKVSANQPERVFMREMERSSDNKFPGLSIACRSSQSVLRGIGLLGDPLCVSLSSLKFVDANHHLKSGDLEVTPVDCSESEHDPQAFIKSIGADGRISCAKKFW